MRTTTLTYFAILAGWLAFFVTQIVIPTIRGSKLFPFLRAERRDVESKLVEVTEETQIKLMEDHIARVRAGLAPPPVPVMADRQTKTKKKNGV